MAEPAEIADRILAYLSTEPVTVHQIVCKTRLHTRTVKKYLAMIEKIQSHPKMVKEIKGSRVFFKKDF